MTDGDKDHTGHYLVRTDDDLGAILDIFAPGEEDLARRRAAEESYELGCMRLEVVTADGDEVETELVATYEMGKERQD